MKTRWKILLDVVLLILLILLLVGVGFYRSYLDSVPFAQSFDTVATGLLIAIWGLVQNPIVLTALVVIVVVKVLRDPLIEILNNFRETELKAGSFALKVLGDKGLTDESNSIKKSSDESITPELESAVLAHVIEQIEVDTCKYLLRAHGRVLDSDQHTDIIAQEISPINRPTNFNRNELRVAAAGYFLGLRNLAGTVFDIQGDKESRGVTIIVKPKALELIKQRLKDQIESTVATQQPPTQ